MSPTCWILTDGRLGTENSARGLAEALGLDYTVIPIQLRQPWKTLSPWLRLGLQHAFVGDALTAPWPDIVITAGRTPAIGSLYIGQQSPHTVRLHITNPGVSPHLFDLVIAPAHDRLSGANVITTTGALHRVTEEKLDAARAEFMPQWEHLPRPWHGLIIGGGAHNFELTPKLVEAWLTQLEKLGGTILCTTSRRTDKPVMDLLQLLRQRLEPPTICWMGEGPNPYFGILACADNLFVTSDSVSMLSEAASSGKPTYLLELAGTGAAKIKRCHDALLTGNHIARFSGKLAESPPTRLRDMDGVATKVRELLIARGKLSV